MGQEIENVHFSNEQIESFRSLLRNETRHLMTYFRDQSFLESRPLCGYELEAWLLDQNYLPCPESDLFLQQLNNESIVPEISKFNFELNGTPMEMRGSLLKNLSEDMLQLWNKVLLATDHAPSHWRALMIGTLPTVRNYMLDMKYLSPQKRYFALNEQIMNFRKGRPIELNIEGIDLLHVKHHDVITESAATSLQIHIGVHPREAKRLYNASCIASPFIAALCSNSPYLFGKDLWHETRIPIFEQSIELNGFRDKDGEFLRRVTLGNGYVKESIFELFLENLNDHTPLLPEIMTGSHPEELKHLILHNGTIWRWNRPLIGLTPLGIPHLRIEHRVPSAGPTIEDSVANIALFIGLSHYLARMETPPEMLLDFKDLKTNFYSAAKNGIETTIKWLDGKEYYLQELMYLELLPKVKKTLWDMGLDRDSVEHYIGDIIYHRLQNGQTGSVWQRSYIHTHGKRFQDMVTKYHEQQRENIPVHLWSV